MKKHLLNKILFFLLVFPVQAFSQSGPQADRDITGMWKGQLYNDTTQKYLPYELAISEEKGKLTGYSYTLFDIDGKKELGVKRIRIRRKNSKLIIEDVEMVANTFSVPVGRGVKWMGVANLLSNDSIMELIGDWSTAPTREYRPLTGSLHLQRAVEFRPQVLFKKLEELHLDQSLSFVRDEKNLNQDIAKVALRKKENASPENAPVAEPDAPQPREVVSAVAGNNIPAETLTVKSPVADAPKEIIPPAPERIAEVVATTQTLKKVNQPAPLIKRLPVIETVKIPAETKAIVLDRPAVTPPVKEPVKKEVKQTETVKTTTEPPKPKVIVKSPEIKKPAIVSQPPVTKKPVPIATVKEPVKAEVKKPVEIPAPAKDIIVKNDPVKQQPAIVSAIAGSGAAANVAERKISNTQDVFYTSDSLILTLYDNGDVDGDTVSVLMNGNIIFARQGLSTRANNKTIYITEDMPDSILLVMYAENLGSIPPNTGLLVVRDGEAVYDVRFKADLQSNAAIILRRRRKQ